MPSLLTLPCVPQREGYLRPSLLTLSSVPQREGYRAPRREQSATEQLRELFARQQRRRTEEETTSGSRHQ